VMYHFLSGYTARVAGTEVGVREPEVAFSACFSAAFLVRHPTVYAQLLAARMQKHKAAAWLVNTGWSGGPYGTGTRIQLPYTRAIIDAIHSGALAEAPMNKEAVFGLSVPTSVPGVPDRLLLPEQAWPEPNAFRDAARKLATLFEEHFSKYSEMTGREVQAAGPKIH
jgi:phosphoenolpyruvate carboxykinase (ATP)